MKDILRAGLGQAARLSPRLRRRLRSGLTVFNFHEVTDSPSPFIERHHLYVTPTVFRRQVMWIKDHFQVVHPDRLVDGNIAAGSALVTFDDGWNGCFETALPILDELNIPSLHFLNMATTKGELLISAVADYLGRTDQRFCRFMEVEELKRPYHLTLTPAALEKFEREAGSLPVADIAEDQGVLASFDMVKQWQKHRLVRVANHLYNHWNAVALSADELSEQYSLNLSYLKAFENYVPLFAFPNGQPGSCFTETEISVINALGARRLFTAKPGIARLPLEQLIDRVSLSNWHNGVARIWFQLWRATT